LEKLEAWSKEDSRVKNLQAETKRKTEKLKKVDKEKRKVEEEKKIIEEVMFSVRRELGETKKLLAQ